MLLGREGATHHHFTDLPGLLLSHVGRGALLVVNDTRVIPARLFGHKLHPGPAEPQPGAKVELLLCEPAGPALDTPGLPIGPALDSAAGSPWRETWLCLYRASKPLRPATEIALVGERPPTCTVLSNEGGGRVLLTFSGHEPGGLFAALSRIGHVPLPPYIHRDGPATPDDRERYQTIYAQNPGAVAAPTAGLHFTPEVLRTLADLGIERAAVTLHVGPGTFAPLKTDDLSDHVMHQERYHVPPETAAAIGEARAAGRKVIAVGTTVVRTLETATPPGEPAPRAGPGETRLFLHPPYRFRAVDALLTNFHLPRSTLLMLVSAFAGRRRVLAAYTEAVQQRYRFFSYGDAMLIPAALEDL
jgi:S-adenosylmethionine:tRNA ribosyltransferase-isomerase